MTEKYFFFRKTQQIEENFNRGDVSTPKNHFISGVHPEIFRGRGFVISLNLGRYFFLEKP